MIALNLGKEALNLQFRELNIEEKKKLGHPEGVKFVGPLTQELQQHTNIGKDFIITKVNSIRVKNLDQFFEAVKDKRNLLFGGTYPDGTHTHYYID